MKIAVTQPYLQFEKQQDNYLNIKNLIQDVDADIICLPELFSTGVTKRWPQKIEQRYKWISSLI